MRRTVHVIASFNLEGDIRPLWLRLSLNPESPAYQIINPRKDNSSPYWQSLITYYALVRDGKNQHSVKLLYDSRKCTWEMIMNNSAFQ